MFQLKLLQVEQQRAPTIFEQRWKQETSDIRFSGERIKIDEIL